MALDRDGGIPPRLRPADVARRGGLGLLDVVLPPAEAAEHLGLSRPFITRLLDAGDIPSMTLPGSRHRVVRLADVLVFQQRRERRRRGRRQVADVSDDLETAM
ncbi:helix-turn-helix domain-containing protein [Streptomyces pseudogriseolus]|uniref:helix-turn-helix domain-containing protein n=1 Tax=Streptomyces pseudogriseolus TaxID=36817 RepID=UPI003FA27F57